MYEDWSGSLGLLPIKKGKAAPRGCLQARGPLYRVRSLSEFSLTNTNQAGVAEPAQISQFNNWHCHHLGTQLHNCTIVQLSTSEQEIDFHMCHMSTFWSEDLVSCQFHSDLRTSNILYAIQIKMKLVYNQKEKKYLFITDINWSVAQLSLEDVLPFPRSGYNWHSFQETVFYENMWFIIILYPVKRRQHLLEHMIGHFVKTNFRL